MQNCCSRFTFLLLFLPWLALATPFEEEPEIKSPVPKEMAQSLVDNVIARALAQKALVDEKALPDPVKAKVTALENLRDQLKVYAKTGKAPLGILTWFQTKTPLTEDDGKYIIDIIHLCALDVDHLLRFQRTPLAEAEAKDVQKFEDTLGKGFLLDQRAEILAAIRAMREYRPTAIRYKDKNLTDLGRALRTRCYALGGITDDDLAEWKENLPELLFFGGLSRAEKCRAEYGPIFKVLLKQQPALP
jgi:hypothetical protein